MRSSHTSRRSAKLPSPSRLPSNAHTRRMFKDGGSHALHLNRAELIRSSQLKKTAYGVEELVERSQKNHHRQRNHGKGHKGNNKCRQYGCKLLVHGASTNPSYPTSDDELTCVESSLASGSNGVRNCGGSPRKSTNKSGTRATSQSILIPCGYTGQRSRGISNRTKHARLQGADLYVARLGWRPLSSGSLPDCCVTSVVPIIKDRMPQSGSLHEELRNPQPRQASIPIAPPEEDKQPTTLSSRPCYQCVSYMHSVGIKRVFWTTDTGEWECAKVRDMVEALDSFGAEGAGDVATALGNVFVTKHEVLMLRRTMGNV